MCQAQSQHKQESASPRLPGFLERAPAEASQPPTPALTTLHGHTLPPRTLHRWPAENRTLCSLGPPQTLKRPPEILCAPQISKGRARGPLPTLARL